MIAPQPRAAPQPPADGDTFFFLERVDRCPERWRHLASDLRGGWLGYLEIGTLRIWTVDQEVFPLKQRITAL